MGCSSLGNGQTRCFGHHRFDSSIARHSLTEAGATIDGIKNIMLLYKTDKAINQPNGIAGLILLLNNAQTYLKKYDNFNGLDRLTFISSFINPFYKQLYYTRLQTGIGSPEGQSPVNFNAKSIF
jgi:hypothetical protein